MEVKFISVTMNCIHYDNNFDEVIEFIKNEYGDKFDLNFTLSPNKDCMVVVFDMETYRETHYMEDGDYIVCLPDGELAIYDEIDFKQIFERY